MLPVALMHVIPPLQSLARAAKLASSSAPALEFLLFLFCHRDLKLDNTLLDMTKPPMLKLCDFGFAKTWESYEDANMYTHIG